MTIRLDHLSSFLLDVLKEVGNIGAGKAATALSEMIQKKIEMKVPCVKVLPFGEIAEHVGGDEKVVATVFLRVEGDVPGNMFFLLDIDAARFFLGRLLGMESGGSFDELAASALQEIGNILAGSYLSALADFTRLRLVPSVPGLAVDMAMAILGYGLLEVGRTGDYALVIDTTLMCGSEQIEGHFFFIPDPPAFETLFRALGVSA